MKKKTIILITVLSSMAGFFLLQNINLSKQIEEAKKFEEVQKVNQNMQEMQGYFASKLVSVDFDKNYDSWVTSMDVADQLHEDSDGNFKKEWGLFLAELSQQHEIDPFIVYELLKTETGGTFDPTLVGPETRFGHAYGLAQFMKNTAPWIADMADLPYNDELLFDPLYSIQLSVTYLDFLYNKYNDWDHALTAYHRGMGGLETYLGENGHAKSAYAVEIQDGAKQFDLIAYNK
ncbi:lytic transglycosylase domain-containing protein [Halalkalibacter krulwichiae]|uniref:Transglycosylase SLT domain protein n=1 Tax=Halalkalibacter krulwichiae TaxID=199441 RepID=A0A1X9MD77_9BACI|nr:transglycosylase SLT domain-containing protein [Halalkalibacter krulwichiae]ARK30594.1 Transglycosylase SLT domain protein [Halalkalibacter krulwichiae]